MNSADRKRKVEELLQEHTDLSTDALYIPKMAYRPPGKDEKHISFFPSELQREKDIYTEFVSIAYDSEDAKRTLYLLTHNPHWSEEYELVTSKSGHERHIIPVSELKVISDINSRANKEVTLEQAVTQLTTKDINIKDPESERDIVDVLKGIEKALLSINQKIK